MNEEQVIGPLRAGLIWGGVGGVAGFLASLLAASIGGILAAVVIGIFCGRRAAAAAGRRGGISGLIGGAVASPVFALGASAGALILAQDLGVGEISSILEDILGMAVSNEEAWQFFLAGLFITAVFQGMVLILASVVAGSRALRKGGQ